MGTITKPYSVIEKQTDYEIHVAELHDMRNHALIGFHCTAVRVSPLPKKRIVNAWQQFELILGVKDVASIDAAFAAVQEGIKQGTLSTEK